ncbi:hypothetical protein [Nitrosopumilus sp.]|uniref:hypothetical protein n=1 Tax=Nitrosopumilus sp. TaxID=2024843 RepID=UPI0029313780|nr:hypothetical protein [Nitrosopumilus sp.]
MVHKYFQLSAIAIILPLLASIGFSGMSFGDEDIESPRKQLEKGIDIEDIVCKTEHVLVILQSDKPACLSNTTFLKLEERGHIKSIIKELPQESSSPKEIKKETTVPPTAAESNVGSGSTIKGDTGQASTAEITNVPASAGSIVNFYITDDDLNTRPDRVDIVDTTNLLEFSINGIPIEGPKKMTETGFDTGQFYVKLQLPESINGEPLNQDDIVEVTYLDESDAGGEPQKSSKSIPLSQTYAQVQTSNSNSGSKTRIGHEFTVRIYEPDANLDSRDEDRIPLSRIEYRGEGGIRTTLNNPVFDANASALRETGENTGIFEVIIKIPRTIDGDAIHIGDWYELRYVDVSTPSNSSEEIKLRGKIGN